MLLLVPRHPTCASCVAWMRCRMSNSIKHAWACPDQSSRRGHWILIAIMLFFVLRHPTYHHVLHECVVGCPVQSSMNEHVPINHRGVGIRNIAIMSFLVLRHPTCVSYIAWMCCRMSDSIKHVWACPDLSFDRLGLYTFLHSLRSNFSPSRPLQLCFEAACETSFPRDIHAMQCTQKKP